VLPVSFHFFPGKRALTLIHQFQCWEKIPVKFAVHNSMVYRVGLNGLDPFIKLCDFFFFSKQPGTTICNMDFHNSKSGKAAVTSSWEHLLVQKY